MSPYCHRLSVAWVTGRASMTTPRGDNAYADYELEPSDAPEVTGCMGSRCALWTPAGRGPVAGVPVDPTRGNCADNPYAEPWSDPAKDAPR